MANIPEEDERAELIARVGKDVITEYWQELIYGSEAYDIMPEFCTVENAQFWLDIDVFKRWFAARAQRQLMASLESPQRGRSRTSQRSSRGSSVAQSYISRSPSTSSAYSSDIAIPPYSSGTSSRSSSIVSSPCPSRSPSPSLSLNPDSATQRPLQYYYDMPPTRERSSAAEPSYDTFTREDKAPVPSSTPAAEKEQDRVAAKRPRSPSVSSDSSANVDSTALSATQKKGKPRASMHRPKKLTKQDDDEKIWITSAKWVHKLVTLTSLPETCWTIPDSSDGTRTAYLLDLSGDDPKKWMKDGVPMSMAAIIKSEDQDASVTPQIY
ncbi:hypothetical protein K466DRAFT_607364 [Polyporus arcularius HHB13444]|uniref:Uncharacterized protein n=1 Tax=Polyporus arcularius HHB13444 TaxID=1314778 RepID=A0A5C3NMX8_9APHY|nr:hypothetical protein K466DRAFT_607364 [Polyporus arcularius HHB13444]